MVFFGLKHTKTGALMGLRIVDNPEDSRDCNDTYACLVPIDFPNDFEYPLFAVSTQECAEQVANHSESWYNTTTQKPANDYVGELEVVKFSMMAV